jgi:hypothetical protein
MPFPDIYTKAIFAAVVFFCFATAIGSVPFYNTLYRKDLLSDTFPSAKASSPWIYTAAALFGIAAGVSFAFFDITACDIFVLIMIPAAVTVCICDTLNSFIPLIGIILTGFCIMARMIAQCLTEGAFWPLLTFAVGGIFGFAIMMLINFISVKFGAEKADKGNIILVTMLWASSGIFGGALILAAAELAAILFYILPNYIIAKKQKIPVPFSEIRYPLSPFLFICYYAAVSVGIF